jgi:hypothetical protein
MLRLILWVAEALVHLARRSMRASPKAGFAYRAAAPISILV